MGEQLIQQLVRFGVTGLLSNSIIYLGYLAVTWVGMGHKSAMTLCYLLGILMSFVLNRSWTFRSRTNTTPALLRYGIVYFSGYIVNFLILYIFVDFYGFPHQLVQGAAILTLAVAFFLAQKFWIFSTARADKARVMPTGS